MVGDELAALGGGVTGWVSFLWERYLWGKVDVVYRAQHSLDSTQAVSFVRSSIQTEPQLWSSAGLVLVSIGSHDATLVPDLVAAKRHTDKQVNEDEDEEEDDDSDDDDAPPLLDPAAVTTGRCKTTFAKYDANLLALLRDISAAIDSEVMENVCVHCCFVSVCIPTVLWTLAL